MESTSSYQLKQGEDNYIFSLTLVDPDIKLSCEDSRGQIYAKIFSLEDIKSIDQIFSTAQTNFDIVEIFDNILRNEKVRVEEDSGLIQIVLFIVSEKRQIKISLDKEEVGNIQGQEEKTFAYDANQIINQIGENLDLNTANYNIEKNFQIFKKKKSSELSGVKNENFLINKNYKKGELRGEELFSKVYKGL